MGRLTRAMLPVIFLLAATHASCGRHVTVYVDDRSGAGQGSGTRGDPYHDLTLAVERAPDRGRLTLAAGRYHLSPAPFTDETCGNCEEPTTSVAATRGLFVKGKSLNIVGAGMDATIIHTHAGYGILFEDSRYSALQDLTVTGGTRDPDPRASDAAVVVRRGQATLLNVRIADNLGDPAVVASTLAGIIGVAGREGSRLVIRNSEILRNSWDGIALYRQAHALIEGSLIDGVDPCRGGESCGGRGVGIGMTWDARASLINTVVRRYWKGIGVFVDARAEIHGSLVEEMMTWGIAVWDGERGGRPVARVEDNIIYATGACGASIASGPRQAASRAT